MLMIMTTLGKREECVEECRTQPSDSAATSLLRNPPDPCSPSVVGKKLYEVLLTVSVKLWLVDLGLSLSLLGLQYVITLLTSWPGWKEQEQECWARRRLRGNAETEEAAPDIFSSTYLLIELKAGHLVLIKPGGPDKVKDGVEGCGDPVDKQQDNHTTHHISGHKQHTGTAD